MDKLHQVAGVLLEYEKVDGDTFAKLMDGESTLEGADSAPQLAGAADSDTGIDVDRDLGGHLDSGDAPQT